MSAEVSANRGETKNCCQVKAFSYLWRIYSSNWWENVCSIWRNIMFFHVISCLSSKSRCAPFPHFFSFSAMKRFCTDCPVPPKRDLTAHDLCQGFCQTGLQVFGLIFCLVTLWGQMTKWTICSGFLCFWWRLQRSCKILSLCKIFTEWYLQSKVKATLSGI